MRLCPIDLSQQKQQKPQKYDEKFFGAFFSMELQAKTSKALLGGAMREAFHCLGFYHTPSTHHRPSKVSASAKHPLARQLPKTTSHNSTESPKKPEMSTLVSNSHTMGTDLQFFLTGTFLGVQVVPDAQTKNTQPRVIIVELSFQTVFPHKTPNSLLARKLFIFMF